MPELPLSLDLHLHHRVVSILDALQGFLDAWEQVDDLLFADQDLTVGGAETLMTGPSDGGHMRGGVSYLRWVYRSLRTLSWFWTV